MKILLTGGAGFIGSHLARSLLDRDCRVVILDDFNDYYSPRIKEKNLAGIASRPCLEIARGSIGDKELLRKLFASEGFDLVVHLAARAGVRPSFADPLLYQDVNVGGTLALLEASRSFNTKRVIFASSSSVYGDNPARPWRENLANLFPLSPYGVTKLMGEHLCRIYHRVFGLKVTALRFFTAYGPRQRPDMAIHKFARLIQEGKEVPVFGDGTSQRDYTYIGDIIEGILKAIEGDLEWEVINLGSGRCVVLEEVVDLIGRFLKKPVRKRFLPEQPGDAPATWADLARARHLLGYEPKTEIARGIEEFIDWFKRESER